MSKLYDTDKEFLDIFDNFANNEVVNEPDVKIDTNDRYYAIIAVLLGCQGLKAFKQVVKKALHDNVSPIAIKEIVYQAVDYLGYGRVVSFLDSVNVVFEQHNIKLPLESQSTTNLDTRLQKGEQAQVTIFGDSMKDAYKKGTVNKWLAQNCFGDFYTRTGLDLRERELITFCFLYSQGGCEPQVNIHIQGNVNMGNSKEYLKKVVLNCLPYVGYPRTLNALNCLEKA